MPPPPLGCDLSHHHPRVDFGTLKRSGFEFVGLKATEGADSTDPTFADRRARAQLVGFRRLVLYHVVRPLDDARARARAYRFAQVVGALASNERLVLDVAGAGWGRRERPAAFVAKVVYHLKIALSVRATDVILSASLGWARGVFGDSISSLTFMTLGAARYAPELGDVSPWTKATVWQRIDDGVVSGVSGRVDLDEWLDQEAWV